MLFFHVPLCFCSALLGTSCSARLLVCSSDPLFSSFRLLCSSVFRLLCSHSFYSSFLHLSALLLLSALLDGRVLTLFQKKGRFHSSPRKFPPFFQKFHPTPTTFNTALTHI